MDNDEFVRNFGEFIDRHAAASEIDSMNVDSVDFKNELRQIEREIDFCKPALQRSRNEYENMETEICDAKQLQRKARFVLDNVLSEEQDLHDRFENLRLNYEACVKKSGYEDPIEMLRVKMDELTIQRRNLLEELVQLRRKASDNAKKLARAKAMIAEQEEKNATRIQELKEISERVPISPDIKKRIDIVLKDQEINESDGY